MLTSAAGAVTTLSEVGALLFSFEEGALLNLRMLRLAASSAALANEII